MVRGLSFVMLVFKILSRRSIKEGGERLLFASNICRGRRGKTVKFSRGAVNMRLINRWMKNRNHHIQYLCSHGSRGKSCKTKAAVRRWALRPHIPWPIHDSIARSGASDTSSGANSCSPFPGCGCEGPGWDSSPPRR